MDPVDVARRLAADAEVFRHLLSGVTEEQVRWKPAPERWSLLEVINHLADEERDDFRTRLDLTLHQRGRAWPSIDPPRWAEERGYNRRDPASSLRDFLSERARSVAWLEGLGEIDESASYEHPSLGLITAGDLLSAWVAHDFIHIRQMTGLHRDFLAERAAPHRLEYAGDW
jgi:hypothetical protein